MCKGIKCHYKDSCITWTEWSLDMKWLPVVGNYQNLRLSRWILDRYQRGLPLKYQVSAILPNYYYLHGLWANRFLRLIPKLKSKHTRKYDSTRQMWGSWVDKRRWFNRVQEIIQRYGILEQDIYTIWMNLAFKWEWYQLQKVIHGSETRDS